MTETVVVRDLHHRYGTTPALDGMSWSARAGAVTAVLGPNGAGKTTTIEMAEGLRRPDAGEIRVLGTDPWQASAQHRARVGVMLQEGGLPGGTRPSRLLRHLARMYASPVEVDPLMDRLGITAFDRTTMRRLSGGQRQRVALAAALVGRPEVLFLDEPTAGLDPHARRDVWTLVKETRDNGVTVVVTTHSFEEAERLADRVVVLARGRVVADGSVAEVAGAHGLEQSYFSLTEDVR
ncbi:ABC transporter ATP-binding protein [Luteipulveratus sp. YIM 133132]|uniref:ABC transporter ATP-binding protein n=1 Tax=Luteipulveratus flavus TaxID=3031728 RepID=A0ABT6C7J3_9MICO|nr:MULTISPECIES: ABC transporter ATP-binding protein [unclassified Luteipulveratus]MDE9364499.1 ABC transporter ATP-binding protein [Luteipulveratus sp. YIM 133132]MDF8264039.1 ABC transporter ATP-binding protein [Luteipulveratus sp. YIM 133296]